MATANQRAQHAHRPGTGAGAPTGAGPGERTAAGADDGAGTGSGGATAADGASDAGAGAGDLHLLAARLRRMNGEINRLVHGFAAAHGLHVTDVQALAAILDATQPMTPSRLREHLGLTSGAVTACVDRLERAGHVRRVRESADRRVVHLHYVPDAREAARAHFRPLAEAAAAARDRFDDAELAVVTRFMTALDEELRRARPTDR